MSKFVKIAAPPTSPSLLFDMLKGVPMFNEAMKQMFKDYNPLNPVDAFNKFLVALQDPDFQDLLATLAPNFISHRGQKLNINEKDMFKNYDYYYKTKGTPLPGMSAESMPTIGAGAYQSTTGQLPKKDAIPVKTFASIVDEIKQITAGVGFQTLDKAAKRKILQQKINQYSRELAPFREYLKNNFPVLYH